jgi:hypothetical protein
MTRQAPHTRTSRRGKVFPAGRGARKGKLVIKPTKEEDKTWYLQIATGPNRGKMDGRDADASHPDGTMGKRDKTVTLRDQFGEIHGRKSE